MTSIARGVLTAASALTGVSSTTGRRTPSMNSGSPAASPISPGFSSAFFRFMLRAPSIPTPWVQTKILYATTNTDAYAAPVSPKIACASGSPINPQLE